MPLPTASFTRPSDTTSYASGDYMANSTTAASTTPLQFTVDKGGSGGTFIIRGAQLTKTTTTTSAASFRLHLYKTQRTPANGDNGSWSMKRTDYLGAIDISCNKTFSDGAGGSGVPTNLPEIPVVLGPGAIIYGYPEARDAYSPGSAEQFDFTLDIYKVSI